MWCKSSLHAHYPGLSMFHFEFINISIVTDSISTNCSSHLSITKFLFLFHTLTHNVCFNQAGNWREEAQLAISKQAMTNRSLLLAENVATTKAVPPDKYTGKYKKKAQHSDDDQLECMRTWKSMWNGRYDRCKHNWRRQKGTYIYSRYKEGTAGLWIP